jgi:hypothetical protein
MIEQLAKGNTGHFGLLMLGNSLAWRLKEIATLHKKNEGRTSKLV